MSDSIDSVHPSWFKKTCMADECVQFRPVLEKTWSKLSDKTKAHLYKKKPGMFGSKLITDDAHDLSMAARSDDDDNDRTKEATSKFVADYFTRPSGGGSSRKRLRKSKKIRKSKKLRKSNKSRKHQKSKKSRKAKKNLKSRKLRKSRR